ncbi:MAG TPA: isochorismate synthase [bacterium]|nr:isochorismate synthase [bacterium]
MASLSTMTPPAPTVGAPALSAWDLARTAIEQARRQDTKTVLVLGFTAPVGDPVVWLSRHHGIPAMYWRGRDGWEYAGLGAAHVIGGHGESAMRAAADEAAAFVRKHVIAEPAPAGRRPRFFGGFAFDPHQTDRGPWRDSSFGDAALILPEALYVRRDTQSYMFFAFEVTPRTTSETLVDRLALFNQRYWGGFAGECPAGPRIAVDEEGTDAARDAWLASVRDVLRRIDAGDFVKTVIAHCQPVAIQSPNSGALDPWPVVRRLRDFDASCYHFGFQYDERFAFLGASPERLLRWSGGRLESEAIAGTVVRGVDPASDQARAEQLLASAKDQHEHRVVVDAVRDALRRLAASDSPDPVAQLELSRLRTLTHLRSAMAVDLRSGVTPGQMLEALHPTPAVAGTPRAAALAIIRAVEAIPRGWYAAPVGWIGADSAEFAVAIRSALLGVERGWLYAGAGLVRGSVPDNEWCEIQDKLSAFHSAVHPAEPQP